MEKKSDRINNLPDNILYKIIQCLDIKDFSVFSMVSKSCRELCRSLPFLTFNCMPYKSDNNKRIQLMDFLDNLLLRRKGIPISTFCVEWLYQNETCFEEENRILAWLRHAAMCHISALHLDLILDCGENFRMPLEIIKCKSLKYLLIDLNGGILKLPSVDGFTNIKVLLLIGLKISAHSFEELISSLGNKLVELALEFVSGLEHIHINSSSLQYFDFTDKYPSDVLDVNISAQMLVKFEMLWVFDRGYATSLNLYAPNLESLYWEGSEPYFYNLGSFQHLKEAQVNLIPRFCSHRKPHLESLIHCIQGINKLVIYEFYVMELYFAEVLPISFENLHTLCLYFCEPHVRSGSLIPALASILKRVPNLKTLIVRTSPHSTFTYNMSWSESLLPRILFTTDTRFWWSEGFINQLEEVVVELIDDLVEFKQVEYLLKHAKSLKKMAILHSSSYPLPSNFTETVANINSTARIILCPLKPSG